MSVESSVPAKSEAKERNSEPGTGSSHPVVEVVRIRPSAGWRALNLVEFWRYRELLWFLALRDIKLRYKQTALGVAWAVLQPLLTMLVFTIFFGRLGGFDQKTGG